MLRRCQLLLRWSREHLYRDDLTWALHLRADSSPQFARDYLITELDYVVLDQVFSLKPTTVLESLTWKTRVLPVQVLGRKATSTAYKFRALLRSLHLETGDSSRARTRTATFLNDMGVESKLAIIPDVDSDVNRRAFANTLPLHDLDHSLHHTMEELRECWPAEQFELFDRQLNTLAKYFSKADNCERFRKLFVLNNSKIEGAALKASIAKMFQTTCPSFIKHRWEYRYEVLVWITRRADFLMWLDPSTISAREDGDPEYSFSDAEIKCLELLFNDKAVAATFWGLAHGMRLICQWGHDLSLWLHSCWCHPSREASCLTLVLVLVCSIFGWNQAVNSKYEEGLVL